MKLILLAVQLFCFCLMVQAQTKSYRAVYETGSTVTISPGKSAINYGFKKVDIISAESFYQYPLGFGVLDSNVFIYGEKIKQHSYYYFSQTNKAYYGKEKAIGNNQLIETTFKAPFSTGWIKDTSFHQKYLQYNCEKAYRIRHSGDTLFAIYSPDIKYPPGMFYLNELPGMLIYSFDAAYNFHSKIVSFEVGNFEIVLPKKNKLKKGK